MKEHATEIPSASSEQPAVRGTVVTGMLHLSIDGEQATYEPGQTYDIPDGAEHSAILEAETCVIDVFADPDRYSPK